MNGSGIDGSWASGGGTTMGEGGPRPPTPWATTASARSPRKGWPTSSPEGRYAFSPEGERRARQLVRSHRLAERLTQDVLGQSAEPSACEFEHLLGTEVVDAICTLLGHPRECPHGYPIPTGEPAASAPPASCPGR